MPYDKERNYLTWKQYLKRFKQGIEGITPLQQARMIYKNTWLMLIGIIGGIIFCSFSLKNLWWLLIILVSALFNTIVVQIGNWQKYNLLKKMEESLNEHN